jgi:hypothetical protein
LRHRLVCVVLGRLLLEVVSDRLLELFDDEFVIIIDLVWQKIYLKLVKAIIRVHPPGEFLPQKRGLNFEGGLFTLIVLHEMDKL